MQGKTEAPAADGCKSPMMTEGRSRPWNIITRPSSGADVAAQLTSDRLYIHSSPALYFRDSKLRHTVCSSAGDRMQVWRTGRHKLPVDVNVLCTV